MNNLRAIPSLNRSQPLILEGMADALLLSMRQDFAVADDARQRPAAPMTRQRAEQLIRQGSIPEREREALMQALNGLRQRVDMLERLVGQAQRENAELMQIIEQAHDQPEAKG